MNKMKPAQIIILIAALAGVFAMITFGIMTPFRLGWQALMGDTKKKDTIKVLHDAAQAIATDDATQLVNITITKV